MAHFWFEHSSVAPFIDRAVFANAISTKISFQNYICLHEHCLLQIIARFARSDDYIWDFAAC